MTSNKLSNVTTISDLRKMTERWRTDGDTIALVPTMGALHAGHLALVEAARRHCKRVIVSIFINPTQFAAGEDFERYPIDLMRDREKLAQRGIDLLYMPSAAEMYPEGFSTEATVAGLSEGLCAIQRPGHFAGVATVVTKLFTQCRPHAAFFGEKDYQQLLIVRRLARDLDLGVNVIGVPTVRETDGLAMSSRNAGLSRRGRSIAGGLFAVLNDVARVIVAGGDIADALAFGRDRLISCGFDAVDYLELRHANTLGLLDSLGQPARLLAAAHIDHCRLIDNIPLENEHN